jgi:hypothetical protein
MDKDGRSFDMRPMTWNAIVLFGALPAAVGLIELSTRPHGLAHGIWLGVVLTSAAISLCWLISIRFESRHLGESAEFWLRHEGVIRPRAFAVALTASAVSLLVLIGGIAMANSVVAGTAVAPAFVSAAVVALMWGKVP